MSRYFLYGTRFSEFEQMMMLVPNFTQRKKGLIIMENLTAESSQSNATYKRLVKNCFANFRHRYLNKRLQKLTQNFTGDWFLTPAHKQRFMTICKPYISKKVCAIIYLLSADEDLWNRALVHIHPGEVSLMDIPLRGISTDGYALYQTARTIAIGKEYIHINEIADEQLIGNFAFRAIIHGILIAKNGGHIVQNNIGL